MAQTRRYCPDCEHYVLARRGDFNHILHLLATVLLCGFWLPVWMLLALTHNPPWRCSQCGSRKTRRNAPD